jgi:hypothetical protein
MSRFFTVCLSRHLGISLLPQVSNYCKLQQYELAQHIKSTYLLHYTPVVQSEIIMSILDEGVVTEEHIRKLLAKFSACYAWEMIPHRIFFVMLPAHSFDVT